MQDVAMMAFSFCGRAGAKVRNKNTVAAAYIGVELAARS
jgi:hypothetical protein